MRWKKIENYCCNWMCLHLSFFHFLVPQSKRERLDRKPGGSAFFPVCQIHVLAALSAWWHTSISKPKYAQLNSLSSPACMLFPFIPNIRLVPNWSVVLSSSISPSPRHQSDLCEMQIGTYAFHVWGTRTRRLLPPWQWFLFQEISIGRKNVQ